MTSAVSARALAGLRDRFAGRMMLPGQNGYDEARQVWNARHDHHPALIAQPVSAGDAAAAVTIARDHGLAVCVRGGGHNHAGYATADGALMLDLSAMAAVRVDPTRRVATVSGGATWGAVNEATQVAGLAVTGADVSRVGVAGATLAGGFGWLHRLLGLSCDNLLAAEVVTADAEVLRVSAQEHPDLFWALRGGGGNFGAVTEFTFALHPVSLAHVGTVICPMDGAADVLGTYQHLCESGGDDMFVRAMLMTAPTAPFVPEQLRGRPAVSLTAAWFGPAGQAESALRELRRFTPPGADLVRPVPYVQLQRMFDAMVPRRVRAVACGGFAGPLSPGLIDALICAAAQPPPMSMVELQPLGGAVARIRADATAVPHRRAAHVLPILGAAPADDSGDEQVAWAEAVNGSLPAGTILGPSVLGMGRDEPEDRVREAYGQALYDRLAATKAAYDPDNMFRFNQNVRPAGRSQADGAPRSPAGVAPREPATVHAQADGVPRPHEDAAPRNAAAVHGQPAGPADADLAAGRPGLVRDQPAEWERWWSGLDGTPGEIVWDADARDLETDLEYFAAAFGQRLPVVDLGCGDGRQTRFLIRHFATVLGVDVSRSAIGRARAAGGAPGVSYRILDARDHAAAAGLHRRLGDVNVYIRGVLQALPPVARPQAVETIAELLGGTGTLFIKELPPEASSYFAAVTGRHGLSPGLARVMRLIPPGQITAPDLVGLFPGDRFDVLSTGTSHIHTVNTLPDGEVITVPAIYAVIRPRQA